MQDFAERVQNLDDDMKTVCLVTHTTTSPDIAKSISNADKMEIRYATAGYASMLVLDIPSETWKDAGLEQTPAKIALAISQKETLKAEEITPAIMAFRERHTL